MKETFSLILVLWLALVAIPEKARGGSSFSNALIYHVIRVDGSMTALRLEILPDVFGEELENSGNPNTYLTLAIDPFTALPIGNRNPQGNDALLPLGDEWVLYVARARLKDGRWWSRSLLIRKNAEGNDIDYFPYVFSLRQLPRELREGFKERFEAFNGELKKKNLWGAFTKSYRPIYETIVSG